MISATTSTPKEALMTITPPGSAAFDSAVSALSNALVEIDAAHRRIRHRLAHDLGFSTVELTAVFVIGNTEECTPKQLSAELDLSTGAITAMVDRLERAGQVERIAHPTDRRSQILTLTFRGEEAMASMLGLYNSAIEDVVTNSPGVVDPAMIDILHRAAAAIDAAATETP
ncbi:Multiple antibiotic resistance protein MarR [Frondihabitans sp. 762G35]|uniref:MarR family winged helix-turn-helix transcriptional regulator n=1 Tax=Frondihabitans sp. 762G35 TaxID=1446794 RepID=UPI000D205816|nr:MarR family winged helix-turn-helix transcriptional regulator [Frondihabitans sp. 762G35]ARC58584.1 Multiple antibiotic resistance protein MarR [Frondihabitans sp. 762G35]